MRILALETSGAGGTVAVAEDARLIAEESLPGKRRSTQTLVPAIRALLARAGWKPADVELVAVSIGPGSFTGLRLGVATAKLFAYATGAAVLAVDTMRVIAAQAEPKSGELHTLLDAGRGELLVGHFRFATDGVPNSVAPTRLVATDDWLSETNHSSTLTGNGLLGLMDRLPSGAITAPTEQWEPRAATVAQLALHDHSQGRTDDIWTLVPVYYRRSAAEEVWEKKRQSDA